MAPARGGEQGGGAPSLPGSGGQQRPPGSGSAAAEQRKRRVRWFQAGNNYLSARHAAMRKFHLLMERVNTKKWTNDRVLELDDPERTNTGGADGRREPPLVVFDFPPVETISFYCVNSNDPDSQVSDASEVTAWRRASEIHGGANPPTLFPAPTTTAPDYNSGSPQTLLATKATAIAPQGGATSSSYYGKIYQGGLQNGYFVSALQALALRPLLLQDLFSYASVERGIYVLMFYKNGQFCSSEVDDWLPCDGKGLPVTCVSEQYPYVLFPSIAEKAYAKLHCNGRLEEAGWEIIGEGGNVEECLSDLTGGIGGRFDTCDVSPDRLFVYLHQLQREALFCCSINQTCCDTRGVKLSSVFSYTVNRVVEFEGNCFVQLHCNAPYLADGGLSDSTPYALTNDPRWRHESAPNGFFWMSIFDFCSYFETIHECRLVNSGDRGSIAHMPPPRLPFQVLPSYVKEPMFEMLHACADLITDADCPQFALSYQENKPCEILCCAMQTDERLGQCGAGSRYLHIPVALHVYEEVPGTNQYVFVTKSNWMENARDSVCCFKAPRPGNYLVQAIFPTKIPDKNTFLNTTSSQAKKRIPPGADEDDVVINRMVFRVYSTRRVSSLLVSTKRELDVISEGVSSAAIRWSLVGSRNPEHQLRPDLPAEWVDREGYGVSFASRLDRNVLESIGRGGAEDACYIM